MVGDLPDYTKYVTPISAPPPATVGNPKKYEGTVAAAGTPVTLDVNADLDHNAGDGYIVCDGPGNLQVDISKNGLAFETDVTVEEDEVVLLKGLNVDTIRIDATVSGTAYRALVI